MQSQFGVPARVSSNQETLDFQCNLDTVAIIVAEGDHMACMLDMGVPKHFSDEGVSDDHGNTSIPRARNEGIVGVAFYRDDRMALPTGLCELHATFT